MTANMQCAYPKCREKVIGQCFGYNGTCGRFYCEEHSWGKYCFECAKEKKTDEIINEYSSIAKGVSRIKSYTPSIIAVMILLVLYLLFSNWAKQTNDDDVYIGFNFACLILMFVLWPFQASASNKLQIEKAREISRDKPHFEEFYIKWKAEKNKSDLRKALQVAGVVALLSVVGAQALIKGSESVAREHLQ